MDDNMHEHIPQENNIQKPQPEIETEQFVPQPVVEQFAPQPEMEAEQFVSYTAAEQFAPQPEMETEQFIPRPAFEERVVVPAQPVAYDPPPVYQKTSKPQKRKRTFSAMFMILCILCSSLAGVAGGYVFLQTQKEEPQAIAEKGILYQSVIRNVAATDANIGQPMTIAQVATAVKEAVVEISTETVTTSGRMGQFINEGAGSGVIITSNGYIVTNHHVIDGASTISVRLSDGSEHAATLVGKDSATDLAVIKIERENLMIAVLGDSSTLQVGEVTVAIGNPLGKLGGTVTEGIISALDREITIDGETMSLLQTDAAINPGNSGGGLFNLYGELAGIVNAKSSGSDIEGLGFAIPINTAKTVIEQLITDGYVKGRVNTGLTLVDIQDTQTAMMYRVNKLGLYIAKSLLDEFEPGDRIVSINDEPVENLADYKALLSKYAVGDTIAVNIVREQAQATVQLTLGQLHE